MRPVYRYLLSVLVCLLLAVGAYFWATGMIDSLYAYRSPIQDAPPAPGDPIGPPVTRRVVFVLVDGLRYDTAQKADVMPTLARLRQQGASARMHSQTPSFSQPGYTTLLTGAWPYLNDGPVFNIDYAEIPTWTQDNLFSAAGRAHLKTAISGYYWFEKLIPQDAVSAHFYTSGEDQEADVAVIDSALPWLDDPTYALVLIHLDQVDYAGHHEGGALDPHWDAAAARADAQLAQIVSKLDLAKDTVLVLSDHGHIDAGGHGGQDPVVLVEPFVLAGAGVKPGHAGEIEMVDVAPTVAALLGLNIPADSQGHVLEDVLALPDSTAAVLPDRTAVQQQRLFLAYSQAIHVGYQLPKESALSSSSSIDDVVSWWQGAVAQARQSRLLPEILIRSILALLVAAVPAWLYLRTRPRHLLWLVVGGLICMAVFHFRYAVLSGRAYSFSALIDPTDLILYCATTIAVGLGIAWLLVGWRTGTFRARPLAAAQSALTLALVTAWFLALPILVNFARNGFGANWTVPDIGFFYVGLLSLVQMMMVAGFGLLFSALSALIARSR